MNKRLLKILFSFVFLLLYLFSVFCNSFNTRDFSKREVAAHFAFVQMQNVVSTPIFKLQNPNISAFAENYSVFSTAFKINYLRNILYSVLITKEINFLYFLSKFNVLKDNFIAIPFHYFY